MKMYTNITCEFILHIILKRKLVVTAWFIYEKLLFIMKHQKDEILGICAVRTIFSKAFAFAHKRNIKINNIQLN